jgi:Phosphatidylethanolamine-binding protein
VKLWSDSWTNGDRIAATYAAGRLDDKGNVGFSDNINPHLAWNELPPGTKSLALVCHDFDVPSRGDDVNKADREIPSDLPRVDFFHWLLVDLPPAVTQINEGEFSRGFTPRGKPGPAVGSPATPNAPATTSATTAPSRRGTTRWCTTTCSRCTRSAWRGCRWRAPSTARKCVRRWQARCSMQQPTRAPTR